MQPGQTLLCAVDADARAGELAAFARRFARATAARLLFVRATGDPAPGELRLPAGDATSALLALIAEQEPDLVLVGACASPADCCGASVWEAVARRAGRPVIVVPPGADGTLRGGPVACAVSLGDDDEAAVRFAGALAARLDRQLVLASVLGAQDAAHLAAAHARTSVAMTVPPAAEAPAIADGTPADVAVRAGALAERLIATVRDRRADVLVMPSRGGGPLSRGLLAPMMSRLWRSAPCPVLVVDP